MKKYKFVGLVVLVGVVLVGINVFILWPRSYEVSYEVGGMEIVEKYDKKSNYYHFQTTLNEVKFFDTVVSKKIDGKKLIDSVTVYSDEVVQCAKFNSEELITTPICFNGNEFIDYSLAGEAVQGTFEREQDTRTSNEYKNIEMLNTLGKKFLVWGQKGYFYLADSVSKDVMFLDEESYYNNLPYQVGEYVLTPDYDSDFTFNKFYMINMKNGKLSEWKLDENINFNSYYLGTYNDVAYLFDRKEKREYTVNPRKKKIELISKSGEASVWSSKWENISTGKLANDDYTFETDEVFEYEIGNGGFFKVKKKSDERFLISDKKVDTIVKIDENEVFYLVGDTLYMYSPKYGEVAMLRYSEWNFNSKNSIFIY